MGFLQRLLGGSAENNVLWFYVRCHHCGAKVRVRVNLFNDLSITEDGGYILRKEILDDKCFRLMRAEVRFDSRRRVISREIEGGEFITREEYEALEPS
jgi:hypothetical protein